MKGGITWRQSPRVGLEATRAKPATVFVERIPGHLGKCRIGVDRLLELPNETGTSQLRQSISQVERPGLYAEPATGG